MGSRKLGVGAAIALAMLFPAPQVSSQTPNNNVGGNTATESSQAVCAARLTQFVGEMDAILVEDPRSVVPLFDLLKKYFPIKGCDVEDAIKICRGSKYFSGISRNVDVDVVVFSSAGFLNPHSGFTVQFGLRRPSGDTELPFAIVNK
jgi:hypothetical protein